MGQDAVFDEGSLPGALPPDRAVGVLVGEEPLAEVFAQPPLQFWLSPGGPLNWSQPVEQATTSRFVFPRKDAGLDAIQEVPPPPLFACTATSPSNLAANLAGNLCGGAGGSEGGAAVFSARFPHFPRAVTAQPSRFWCWCGILLSPNLSL